MTRIVDLPFCYRVYGTPVGMRIPRSLTMVEIASFEIGDDVSAEFEGALLGRPVPFADGVPWFPVPGLDGGALSGPDALSAILAAATTPRGEGQTLTTRSLNRVGNVNRFCSLASNGKWLETNGMKQDRFLVPVGRSMASMFRSVEWDDRDKALAFMRDVAGHMRFVDGSLRTSRFEVFRNVEAPDTHPAERTDLRLVDRLEPSTLLPLGVSGGDLAVGNATPRCAHLLVPYRDGVGFEEMADGIDFMPGLASAVGHAVKAVASSISSSLEARSAMHELRQIEQLEDAGVYPDYSAERLESRLGTIRDELLHIKSDDPHPEKIEDLERSLRILNGIFEAIGPHLSKPVLVEAEDIEALRAFSPI